MMIFGFGIPKTSGPKISDLTPKDCSLQRESIYKDHPTLIRALIDEFGLDISTYIIKETY